MEKTIKPLLLVILSIMYGSLIFGQMPDFTGTWVLNFEKSKLEDKSDELTNSIFIIKQDGDKFGLTRYHIYGEKKNKLSFKMVADAKTRRVKILFKGKLEKTDNGLRATLWRRNFSNIVNYKFGATPNEFIADEVFTGKSQNHHNIWVFDRKVLK